MAYDVFVMPEIVVFFKIFIIDVMCLCTSSVLKIYKILEQYRFISYKKMIFKVPNRCY